MISDANVGRAFPPIPDTEGYRCFPRPFRSAGRSSAKSVTQGTGSHRDFSHWMVFYLSFLSFIYLLHSLRSPQQQQEFAPDDPVEGGGGGEKNKKTYFSCAACPLLCPWGGPFKFKFLFSGGGGGVTITWNIVVFLMGVAPCLADVRTVQFQFSITRLVLSWHEFYIQTLTK